MRGMLKFKLASLDPDELKSHVMERSVCSVNIWSIDSLLILSQFLVYSCRDPRGFQGVGS